MSHPYQDDVASELEAIVAIVAQYPDGVGRQGLEQAFLKASGRVITWRTLLRRLEQLIKQNRVVPAGRGKNAVYRPAPTLVLEHAPSLKEEESYVPLSPEGASVRRLIRRPMMERIPVGYDDNFLEWYIPGQTSYLPQSLRRHLHDLGRTADAEQPAGTYAREIFEHLLIDLSWASSRLEGNSYTRLDTQNLIEFGQRAEGKGVKEAQMILNHKAAIELLVGDADRVGFNRFTFQNLHAALSENLLGDPADEGRLRTRIVQISGTTYHPLGIPQKIEEHFQRLLEKAAAIPDPFEQAFFIMVHIPYLQPFVDVNKRTSRLGANISFIKANLCPLSFVDVPERAYVEGTLGVYELTRIALFRDVFVWAYERSCAQYRVVREAMGDPNPFRLRYRTVLADVVRETVLSGAPPRIESLSALAEARGVSPADVKPFAETALALLLGLHEGALARYTLTPSELTRWKARFASHTPSLPR